MRDRSALRFIQPVMATTSVLDRGMLLRDLAVHTLDGRAVRVSDFRGRKNLVLVFPGDDSEEAPLLAALRQAEPELEEEEAVVLVAGADDDKRGLYGAIAGQNKLAAIYISDRYGEIFFTAHARLPALSAVLDWLRFINAQCPE